MTDLELRLADLRGAVEFPPTPELAAAFERELAREPGRPRRRLRPLVVALAVLVAVAAGVLALSPGARSAFLELFHLRGATVELVDELPTVPVTPRLPLGELVSRAEAERRVGFTLLDLSEPDGIYVREGGIATLVYGSVESPRLLLTELRGGVWPGFLKKVGGSGTRVTPVQVAGEQGLYISGPAHFLMFLDEHGRIRDETTYLAGPTLLWNRGKLLLRLEADVDRREALRLARSVR